MNGLTNEVDGSAAEAATIAPVDPIPKTEPTAKTLGMPGGTGSMSPGDLLGPYRLVRQLGAGGMGVVWEAEELENGRRVAIKLLAKSMAQDDQAMGRFLREGQLAAQLSHPRTTFVFSAAELDGAPYIAMELMPGDTLQDILGEQKKIPLNQAVDYILDIIDGLNAAHSMGVIHRDVKPSNCFLDSDGRAKVGDFGLSRPLLADGSLTQTGTFLGTPLYAAPEQIRGVDVDERTDIYSVGATLFTLVTGRTPFTGDALTVTAQIVTDAAPPIRSFVSDAPAELERIIAKCLEKSPEKRFQSLAHLRSALTPFATGGTTTADIGRRVAAYMIDVIALTLISQFILGSIGLFIGAQLQLAQDQEQVATNIVYLRLIGGIGTWLLFFLYFAICETISGKTLGKRILRLQTVNQNGERPEFWRSALRSFMVPSGFGLILFLHAYLFLYAAAMQSSVDELGWMYAVNSLFNYGPVVFCLLFMRKSNGLRGLHGLLTGTRVERVHGASSLEVRLDVPVVTPEPLSEEGQAYGPFRPVGSLGSVDGMQVLVAKDDVLDRSVFLCVSEGPKRFTESRLSMARMGRPRWLQGGMDGERHWDAFEAIDGFPLSHYLKEGNPAEWDDIRSFLAGLASELLTSIEEDSLPEDLTSDHIWIDRAGNAKLLEYSTFGSVNSKATDDPLVPHGNAVAMFFQVVLEFTNGRVLPVSASRFLEEIQQRPKDLESLRWAHGELERLGSMQTTLGWDSRLGILSISFGTEWIVLASIAFLTQLALRFLIPNRVDIQCAIGFVLTMGVAFAFGALTRGGPVFHFFGIAVRTKRGGEASPLRCGWRNMIAWTPPCALFVSYMMVTAIGFALLAQNPAMSQTGSSPTSVADNSAADNLAPSTDSARSPDVGEAPEADEDPETDRETGTASQLAPDRGSNEPPTEGARVEPMTPEQFREEFGSNPFFLVLMACGCSPLMVILTIVGAIVSIVNPGRGIQDYFAGTRLVMK